ncbi:hypothetical protein RFI_12418, partial [Reticulomyxa filosa]
NNNNNNNNMAANAKEQPKDEIEITKIFPEFQEFNSSLFTTDFFVSSNSDNSQNANLLAKYYHSSTFERRPQKFHFICLFFFFFLALPKPQEKDQSTTKYQCIMKIARKNIPIALDLATTWKLDSYKIKGDIIMELCCQNKEVIALRLMNESTDFTKIQDVNDSHYRGTLSMNIIHLVKYRLSILIQHLLKSPGHQHVLAEIPADMFQEIAHFNENNPNLPFKINEKHILENYKKVLENSLKVLVAVIQLIKNEEYSNKLLQETEQLINVLQLLLNKI